MKPAKRKGVLIDPLSRKPYRPVAKPQPKPKPRPKRTMGDVWEFEQFLK
jgi:hypothetical protein